MTNTTPNTKVLDTIGKRNAKLKPNNGYGLTAEQRAGTAPSVVTRPYAALPASNWQPPRAGSYTPQPIRSINYRDQ